MADLTVDDIRVRVADVEAQSGDDESAHAEDRLHRDVLAAIAADAPNAAALAREALRTYDLDFSRWYA